MDNKVKSMIRGWVKMHKGDTEQLARWMRRVIGISIQDARAAIRDAMQD